MERFCLVSSVLAGCYIIHPAPGARGCRVWGAQRAPAWHVGVAGTTASPASLLRLNMGYREEEEGVEGIEMVM